MKVIFLHIPKTAGQSVHTALEKAFGRDAICPAKVNDQLKKYSIRELNRYQVFSGHLDWSLLDCIQGKKYVFTVLRKPIDRILSFYFYLRRQAEQLDQSDLNNPANQGLRAAKELPPDEYFSGGEKHLRNFLDNHYENFYTFYFAGRHFNARGELRKLVNNESLNESQLLRMALDNLEVLDDVFTMNQMPEVFSAIARVSGNADIAGDNIQVNVNSSVPKQDRMAKLKALGATELTDKRLTAFCHLDDQIWDRYSSPAAAFGVGQEEVSAGLDGR